MEELVFSKRLWNWTCNNFHVKFGLFIGELQAVFYAKCILWRCFWWSIYIKCFAKLYVCVESLKLQKLVWVPFSRRRRRSFFTTNTYNPSYLAFTNYMLSNVNLKSYIQVENFTAVGSQQAKYEQTPQASLKLRAVGCNWNEKGELDLPLNTSSFKKFLIFVHFWILHKSWSIAQESFFQVSKMNRFLVAQIGEVIFSLLSFCLSPFLQDQNSFVWHVNFSRTSAERWWKAPDLHLNTLWMSKQPPLRHFVTWSLTEFKQTGTRTHAFGLLVRVVHHWTTITLIPLFAFDLHWLPTHFQELLQSVLFFYIFGIRCQPFTSSPGT